jgi:hypothetical protein
MSIHQVHVSYAVHDGGDKQNWRDSTDTIENTGSFRINNQCKHIVSSLTWRERNDIFKRVGHSLLANLVERLCKSGISFVAFDGG